MHNIYLKGMITLVQQPSLYTPVYYPSKFKITSNVPELVYFDVKIVSPTNTMLASQRYYSRPDITNGAVFDLSSVLSNLVDYQIANTTNVMESLSTVNLTYKLRIIEYFMLPESPIPAMGDSLETELYNVWNAKLPDVNYGSYNYLDYYVHSGGSAKFLSSKPSLSKANVGSTEYLYFLADSGSTVSKAVVKTNATSGTTLNNISFSPGPAKVHRLNLSNYIISGVQSLEVYLENESGIKLTEVKTYNVIQYPCDVEKVNVLWVDRLGGISSYTFINPLESLKVNRNTIKTNKYKDYTIIQNGVFNASEATYNVSSTSEYTLTTLPLSDQEYRFLSDMLSSEQVFVELSSGLMPVKLITTSTEVKRRKYSTSSLRFELKFESESNLF